MKVRPWRLMSQAYVAFFGGVIAVTVVAWVNSRRLGVDAGKRRLIVLTGVAGLAVVIALFAFLPFDEPNSGLRVIVRAVAVVACLVQMRLQRQMDRAFQLRGVEYASLWMVGLLLTFSGIIVDYLLLRLVVSL
ncbi:hypothetical protein GCM10009534_22890 [Kribbella sandramycini]